jgi:hypothetical protein
VVVVMIAENAENALRRGERCQRRSRRFDVASVLRSPADVVAAEHDEVRTFGHHGRDGPRHVVVRDPDASVNVGEETDAQAGERGGKARNRERRPGHAQLMAADGEAVTRGAATHGGSA